MSCDDEDDDEDGEDDDGDEEDDEDDDVNDNNDDPPAAADGRQWSVQRCDSPHKSHKVGSDLLLFISFFHDCPSRREEEVDGADYHFISRLQFEQDILARFNIIIVIIAINTASITSTIIITIVTSIRKFVEHGEYEKAYYGTSLGAIRSVVNSEKICVLNLHPQVG